MNSRILDVSATSYLSLLCSVVGHHLTRHFKQNSKLNFTDLFLGFDFRYIWYPSIMRFNIPPRGPTSNNSHLRNDLKHTCKHELEEKFIEMNSIKRKEYERSDIFPKVSASLVQIWRGSSPQLGLYTNNFINTLGLLNSRI